jgi:hypothetical protein
MPRRDVLDPVAEQETDQRMPHDGFTRRVLHERVTTAARVLRSARALGDAMYVMSEHTAEISYALLETVTAGIRVGIRSEEQRMPALHAGVLHMSVALTHGRIRVVTEKAGKRMSDTDD